MYAVERLSSYISRGVYTVSGPFHPFGGAVDIIVVEQPDGTFKSSPWYVRFGKFQGVLKTKEKVVDVSVNGVETGVRMYLDHKGEAYFLKEVDGEEASDSLYPSSSGDEADEQSHSNRLIEKSQSFHFSANEGKPVNHNGLVNGKTLGRTNSQSNWLIEKSQSFHFSANEGKPVNHNGHVNGKTLGRTNSQSCDFGSNGKIINRSDSRQSRIPSLVFGKRSVIEDRVGEEEGKGSVVRESSLEHAELAAELMDMKWSTALATRKSKRDKTSRFSVIRMAGGESQVNNGSKHESDHSQLCNEDGSLCDSGSEKSRCSGEENVGASSISSSNCEEEAYAHASTVHSSRESCILLSDTCSNNLHVFRDGDGDNFIEDAQIIRNHGMDATGNGVVSESDSLVDSVEKQMLEVMHQDTSITQMVAESINLKVGEVQVVENHFRHENASQMTDSSSLISAEDSHELKLDFFMEKAKGISPSEGSARENFRDHADVQMTDTSYCYSPTKEKLPALDNPLNDSEESFGNPRLTSNPINIPRIHKDVSEDVAHLVKSLPNLWSHAESQDSFHPGHRLCCSLDSNSRSFNSMLWRKNSFNCMKSCVVDKECQSTQDQQTTEGNQISAQLQNDIVKPIVEISLCKHVLYEGMGREAASRAFDSEQLDVNKFASVGHDVIKNDKLVVKIGNHYLPWEAAAPIILEMVSFGSEKFIDPKGIIAVDQVEKTFESCSSEAIITDSGSWRIWPFSFKRSRTDSPLQQTPSVGKASDLENVSDGSVGMDRDKCIAKTNVTWMKMRTVTPTSEQMASLNLKEGRNTVTFTYSTAVLGKQQVDARIYLWKWNTHIVISDVDGTITKSDVLGQFMPLVGFDWSQTGVAHLFSAIKENGYQLLFLSARAISQAYHTRQFLCNLKQDGKVLPDGPVVISPDGFFPSLFREVIRRAPHEFKIACLEDIKALFPSGCNPFYAGFGNRDTDEISYLKVGIPKGKIFIINPKGEIAVNRRVDTKSYKSLHSLVNDMFPPISSSEQEDYNSWNFWRLPAPAVEG